MTTALREPRCLDAAAHDRLRQLATRRFAQSIDVPTHFMREHAPLIARACYAMAQRFESAGRLLAFGHGASATDAQHVAVEFAHPVIVGKRALPAIPLAVERLDAIAMRGDIAMGISAGVGTDIAAALEHARRLGMLTIALTGENASIEADFVFAVPATDAFVVQETHELLYHVLWELVHVFLEHRTGA